MKPTDFEPSESKFQRNAVSGIDFLNAQRANREPPRFLTIFFD
ncbi:MAG: hypothetical protein DF168_00105 [Candidatus Moanabacter tarae]|uniref:Uncharacterized protein n=1 Tax=Candidatus Moanibacter tarae TaxID=2200854 RepID=A0A2Z4AAU5_9BACT|nr:MAG: hypothetical protein DF168_00105 [Candidatus Moanabacter tarae]